MAVETYYQIEELYPPGTMGSFWYSNGVVQSRTPDAAEALATYRRLDASGRLVRLVRVTEEVME